MIDEKILKETLNCIGFVIDKQSENTDQLWYVNDGDYFNINKLKDIIELYETAKNTKEVCVKNAPTDNPVCSKKETTEQSALDIAKELIYSERQAQYGSFKDNMTTLSTLFALMTNIKLTEQQCTQFLIALKLARESTKHKRDNLVDVIGYIALLDDMKNRE